MRWLGESQIVDKSGKILGKRSRVEGGGIVFAEINYDGAQRMVGIVCHNNDIGDGWEREGIHIEYFQQYALKCSYPIGINVIAYAMTH